MLLHKQYRRDKATAWLQPTEGVEFECSHFDPRSPEYINVMTKITKPVRKIIEQNLLKHAEDRKYTIRAFVECNVKGWRTVVGKNEDGTPQYRSEINVSEDETVAQWLPFSQEHAVTLFTKYPQLYTDVVELARDLASYQTSEEELKNSATA